MKCKIIYNEKNDCYYIKKEIKFLWFSFYKTIVKTEYGFTDSFTYKIKFISVIDAENFIKEMQKDNLKKQKENIRRKKIKKKFKEKEFECNFKYKNNNE